MKNAANWVRPCATRALRDATLPDAPVSALMIEVGRRLYMDEASGKKTAAFEAARAALRGVVLSLVRAVRNGQRA